FQRSARSASTRPFNISGVSACLFQFGCVDPIQPELSGADGKAVTINYVKLLPCNGHRLAAIGPLAVEPCSGE
ncbi:MAG: hypothetical protein ABL928_02220, partial [Sphingorhabdus sp.]